MGKKRRGRPRCSRNLEEKPRSNYFKPRGIPTKKLQEIEVSPEEIEAIRLIDLEGLKQEEAADRMGISRKTFWMDLKSAREKITKAIVKGKAIRIIEGDYGLSELGEEGD